MKNDFDYTDEEARNYIALLFDGYQKRKSEKRLYEADSKIPQIIITTYYSCIKPHFNEIFNNFKTKYINDTNVNNFKERYIYNESKLEDVHSPEERKGLRAVYDFVQKKEDLESISIYTLSDIHEILYSFSPYPDFGGKYRKDERYLPGTGVNITSPDLIVHEMNLLRSEVSELVEKGIKLGKELNASEIIEYIDRCVELKCKLIKIHPFGDGNGRSIRAFINLLFRLANIPPVYIKNKERQKYQEAMNSAIGEENDYSKIRLFYYYEICDSIMSLDIDINKKGPYADDEKSLEKGNVK